MNDEANRRSSERSTKGRTAIIQIGSRTYPCSIVNASMGGLGLRVSPGLLLPASFSVAVEMTLFNVLLRWRDGDLVGVQFQQSPPLIKFRTLFG